MYRDRINEQKKMIGITMETMSKRSKLHISEETISRFLSGKSQDGRISTLLDLCETVELEPYELFMDAKTASEFKLFLEAKSANTDDATELQTLLAQNVALQDDIATLNAEIELLRLKLAHKEEIIDLHNYYRSLIGGDAVK